MRIDMHARHKSALPHCSRAPVLACMVRLTSHATPVAVMGDGCMPKAPARAGCDLRICDFQSTALPMVLRAFLQYYVTTNKIYKIYIYFLIQSTIQYCCKYITSLS
jgi:hypothetical protein